jgi:hypothetical protein
MEKSNEPAFYDFYKCSADKINAVTMSENGKELFERYKKSADEGDRNC